MYEHVKIAVPDMAKDTEEFAEAIYNLEDMLSDPDVAITSCQRQRAKNTVAELRSRAMYLGILLPKDGRPSNQQVSLMNNETVDRIAQTLLHNLPRLADLIDMEPLKEEIKEFVANEVANDVEEKWVVGALLDDAGDVSAKLMFMLAGRIAEMY